MKTFLNLFLYLAYRHPFNLLCPFYPSFILLLGDCCKTHQPHHYLKSCGNSCLYKMQSTHRILPGLTSLYIFGWIIQSTFIHYIYTKLVFSVKELHCLAWALSGTFYFFILVYPLPFHYLSNFYSSSRIQNYMLILQGGLLWIPKLTLFPLFYASTAFSTCLFGSYHACTFD